MNKLAIATVGVAAALAVAGCGQSSQDKAKDQVCSARADIQKQVNYLKGLTASTATTSGVKDSLNSIKDDLTKIADAQPDLSAQRQQQVKSANEKFKSQFKSIVSNVGTNLSLSSAQAQLKSAADDLATTYKDTFATVDCGG